MNAPAPDFIADGAAFRARTPLKRIDVRRRVWRVIDAGPKQGADTLLLCPGTLGNADIFRNVINALKPEMRVISVTYPMIGNAIAIADDAVRLLDKLGIEKAHILGSSLGGIIAQTVAARHPARTNHVFVANSLATIDAIRALLPPPAQVARTPPAVLKAIVLDNMTGWPEPAPEFTAIKAFLRNELETRFTGRAFKARALALAGLDGIPSARVPPDRMTVIQARDDPLIAPETRQSVTERYPDAFVHTFKSGGHFPYITRPDEYVAVLRRRMGL